MHVETMLSGANNLMEMEEEHFALASKTLLRASAAVKNRPDCSLHRKLASACFCLDGAREMKQALGYLYSVE